MVKFLFLSTLILFSISFARVDSDILFIENKADKAFEDFDKEFNDNLDFVKDKRKIFEDNIPISVKYGKIIFEYCGLGKTEKEAKANALKGLIEQINVKVKSLEELKKEKIKSNFSSSYKSFSTLEAEGNLKSIVFSEPKFENGLVKVCAYFTEKSLKNTIDYLKNELSIDFSQESEENLKKLKKKVLYLLTLAQYLPNDERDKVKKFALNKLKEIRKYLEFGAICINTIPRDAKVIIDGKEYKPFECVYLPPNKEYLVKISAPGYQDVVLKIYLTRREKYTKTVELPKKVKGKVIVFVYSNNRYVDSKIKEFLSQNNFEIAQIPLAPSAVFAILKDKKQNVYGYTRHIVSLTIKAYKGPELILVVNRKLKPFYTTSNTEDIIFQKKLDKLIKAVLIKFINKLDAKKIKGEEEFDYGVLLSKLGLEDQFQKRSSKQNEKKQIKNTKILSAKDQQRETNSSSYIEKKKKNLLSTKLTFSNPEEFVNYLFKAAKIENVYYELYKPDPDTETYKGVNVNKKIDNIDFYPDKYYLIVHFSVSYPKNYLKWIHPYLSKISKKALRNIITDDIDKYKCTFFISLWPTLKSSDIVSLAYILPNKVCKIFKKAFKENKEKRNISISFYDDFGLGIYEGLYHDVNFYISCNGVPYLIRFCKKNDFTLKPYSFYIPYPYYDNYKNNFYLTLNLKKDITLKGYVPKDIAESIKSFEVKIK